MPSNDTTPPPPPSLVLLFKSPRTFARPVVRAAAERAFGIAFASEPGGKRYVVPVGKPAKPGGAPVGPGRYAVRFMEYLLGVVQGTEPYWSDPTFGADLLGDPRAREAVGAHQGWVAVDGLGLADSRTLAVPADRKNDFYRVMSRLTLELFNLAEEDCVALVVPEMRRVYPNDESWASGSAGAGGPGAPTVKSIRDMLSTKEPALLLGIAGPAMLDTDDPKIARAIAEATAEARRHLPEFLKAWEGRNPDAAVGSEGSIFWVKTTFSDSHGSEQMWVAVTSIRDGVVTGTLQSDPSYLKSVRQGQAVELKLEEVADFLYHDGRAMTGAFTDRVIRDIMEGRR